MATPPPGDPGPEADDRVEPKRDAFDDTMPATSQPASVPPAEPPFRPTAPLDRYRIGTELGRGGMGRVVEALDTQLRRKVALKEVLTPGIHRRFAREIEITARLEHASIVPLYDSGINSEGKPYYVMRKVTGVPLDEAIAKRRDLDERLMLLPDVLSAIDGVAHAHERHVIHRDIKPQNILIGQHGETVVIDWGLAKVLDEDDTEDEDEGSTSGDSLHTQVGSVFGTPGFMAPEQARGEVLDTQGDVYALGATLYQLLSGDPPVRGHSATEVMDKTRLHEIRPLAESAPGVPPELAAIVDKALSFDPEHRYCNAGELGADVRRFLAGQLVAAHEYTAWQRVARFARRHRAVLSVIALALTAVAVMSWIGVHRILTERDAATTARREAEKERHDAEDARVEVEAQRDELLVMQARAQLDLNPTESLAILKRLPPTSPRIHEAYAVAQAAVVRGTAWAIDTVDEATSQAEVTADGRFLFHNARDDIRVFDLDRRRLVRSHRFPYNVRADWILGHQLLITSETKPPRVLDPITDRVEAVAGEPTRMTYPTLVGDRVLMLTASNHPLMFDAASRTVTPIAFPDPVIRGAIAGDGSWYALATDDTVVVFDRAGRELTRHDAKINVVRGSTRRALAVLTPTDVIECTLDPKPVWTNLHLPVPPAWSSYRARNLWIYLSNGEVVVWDGTRTHKRLTSSGSIVQEAGHGVMLQLSNDGKLNWTIGAAHGEVPIPTVMNFGRIAARPGTSRIAIVGRGVIDVFDLAEFVPRSLDAKEKAVFVDDDTLLLDGSMSRFSWFDLRSGRTTTVETSLVPMSQLQDRDTDSHRVLLYERLSDTSGRFWLMRPGKRRAVPIARVQRDGWARLIAGDVIAYGVGDSRVFAMVGDEPARVVAKLDDVSVAGVGIGARKFATVSNTGEVALIDLDTGHVDRTRVPGKDHVIAGDNRGHVLVAQGGRLLRWDGSMTEIAKLDHDINAVFPVDGGIVLVAAPDNATYLLPLAPGAKPRRIIAASRKVPSMARHRLLGVANGRDLLVVDLPSGAPWTFPVSENATPWVDLSPDGRHLVQFVYGDLELWTVPRVSGDFAAWLDNHTNATLDHGLLLWPWQKTP